MGYYPSWRYNRAGQSRLVRSAAEEEAGWAETPAAFTTPPDSPVSSVPSEEVVQDTVAETPVAVVEEPTAPEAPVKRGPGRPRKVRPDA